MAGQQAPHLGADLSVFPKGPSLQSSLCIPIFHPQDPLMRKCIRSSAAVLDGEMVVWNRRTHTFEPFGAQRALLTAVDKGLGPDDVLDLEVGWREAR